MESEKKLDALKQLMKHYHSQDFQLNTSMIKVTMVYRLKVLEMTEQRSYTYSHGIKKIEWIFPFYFTVSNIF